MITIGPKKGFFELMPGLITQGTIETTIWDGDSVSAANIIRNGHNWGVKFHFTVTGPAIPMMCGHFDLVVSNESQGTGPESTLKTYPVDVGLGTFTAPDTLAYDIYVPVNQALPEGVYAISTHLHYTGPHGAKTAAFVESQEVQFF